MKIDFPAEYTEFKNVPGGGIVYIDLKGERGPALALHAMVDKEVSAGIVVLSNRPKDDDQLFTCSEFQTLALSPVFHLKGAVLRPSLEFGDVDVSRSPAIQPGHVVIYKGGCSLAIKEGHNTNSINLTTGLLGDPHNLPAPYAVIRRWWIIEPGDDQAKERLICSWPVD